MTKPRHKYEYEVTPDTTGAKVVRMVGTSKRVLELGPGPGSITRLLRLNSCEVTALENDRDAIDIVSAYCKAVHLCDLNSPEWHKVLADSGKFEVIVAADVLEHLYDPWTLLRELHPLLTDDGQVVVSLPNVGHNAVISCLLTNDFEYRPCGLLDQTHVRFFGISNIQEMFETAGFKIIEVEFVVAAPERTEFAARWRSLPMETRRALSLNRFGSVYQVVVKAVRTSAPGKRLRLNSIEVPAEARRPYNVLTRGKRVIVNVISSLRLRMHIGISRLLERVGLRL